MSFRMLQTSSLEKIFAQPTTNAREIFSASALKGEEFHYQIALWQNQSVRAWTALSAQSELDVELFWQEEVPCRAVDHDHIVTPDVLFHDTRLVPDVLRPVDGPILVCGERWTPVWVSVKIPADAKAGEYKITVRAEEVKVSPWTQELLSQEVTFTLNVIDAVLPKQELIVTHWFHADCIADYYHLEPCSDAHFERMEQALRIAGHYGQNMVLTPIFTPALDTMVGGERTTMQLLKIEKNGDKYTFDFSLLTRFVEMALRCGMRYFEIAHLYTQWGAKATPKIMIWENGELTRHFGWDVEATDPRYENFLSQMLPALQAHLASLGLSKEQIYFHISDEPHGDEHLAQFNRINAFLKPLIAGYHHMDALSSYDFYEKGLVECPVVATNAVAPFLAHDVRPRWVYYCCGQFTEGLSNRFMAMPSYRNRAIGAQLFSIDAEGFLQWGMNFYNSQFSLRHVDPFRVTDADGAFQSGDSFVIYPGEKDALASLRLAVFFEGLQDQRALQLLASLVGKEKALQVANEAAGLTYAMNAYPLGIERTLHVRECVNAAIAAAIATK